MHAKTWVVAAALAFASTAVADDGRVRVHLPRHAKRQMENSTGIPKEILSSGSSVVSETVSEPYPPTSDGETSSDTPLATSDDSPGSDASAPTTNESTSERRSDSSVSESPSRGLPDIDDILTLSLSSTVDVGSTTSETSAKTTDIVVSPTPSDSDGHAESEAEEGNVPTTSDGIVLAPTGLLGGGSGLTGLPDLGFGDKTQSELVGSDSSGNSNPTAPARSSEPANDYTTSRGSPSNTSPATAEKTVSSASEDESSSTGGLLDSIVHPIVSLFPSESEDEPTATGAKPSRTGLLDSILDPDESQIPSVSQDQDSPAGTGTGSSGTGLLDPIIGPVESLIPSASEDKPAGTGAQPTGTGILDPIIRPIESLIPSPTEGSAASTGAKPGFLDPIISPDETPIPSPTEAGPSGTGVKPSGTGILDPIIDPVESLVSSAVDDLTIPPAVNWSDSTAPAGTGATGSEPAMTLLPTVPDAIPSLTGLPIPDLGSNGSDPNTNPGFTNPLGPDPTAPLTDLPLEPTNMTIPLPEPTPSAGPTGGVSLPPGSNSTSTTTVPEDAYTSTSSEEAVVTVPPVRNTTIPEPKPTQPPELVTSIKPVTTVSKEGWLGTQLVADDTTATTNTDLPAPTQSETLPDGMPNSIDASNDVVEQPEGTTLIRIVFDRRLHYEFVAENFTASQQIFMYFPMVISHGEHIKEDEVKMMRLSPIETKQRKGWITTAAFAYVPERIIDSLKMDIHLTNSELYNPPHPIASGIAAAIDPSYGIFPGSDLEVSSGESDDGPGGAPFGGGDDSGEEQTASQKGTTAGIAVGAVGAAVAYGAAMFLVARRYKRKKQSHRRSSSISGSQGHGHSDSPTSDMRFVETGSPATAMMGGALLSRDFSGYGAVAGGSTGGSAGTAGGRHSHGSGQSGAGNSGRTAYISAPVAAENSLGWN